MLLYFCHQNFVKAEGSSNFTSTYVQASIDSTYLAIVLLIEATILIVTLAYWRREIILYTLCTPVCAMLEFQWYATYPTNADFVLASTLVALAVYSFGKMAERLA